jgi:hypothetical protein
MTPQPATTVQSQAAANPVDPHLFDGGAPHQLERSLPLLKAYQKKTSRRMLLFVLVSWLPLAMLVVIRSLIDGSDDAHAFFYDAVTQVRFLVALPAFVFAERDCLPRLARIIRHIPEVDLIRPEDMARFESAVASTKRLLDSKAIELLTVIAAYAVVVALIYGFPEGEYKLWHRVQGANRFAFTAAGWWHGLVSLPLLLVIILGWLWRVVLWSRLHWIISRLNLRLIPGHPDHCGGLKFVSASLRAFRMVAFGLGALVGGVAVNRVIHFHEGFDIFKGIAIGLAVIVVILFVGPLVVYIPTLRRAHHRGIWEYGALAGNVGGEFEQKWLRRPIDESALDVPDFSSTTDLYGIVANVYEMKEVPFGLKNVGLLVVAALVPLIPAALLVMPLKDILQDIVKLIL